MMPRKRLSPEAIKELTAVAVSMRKERGTIVFREGKPCRGAFLIRSGRIKLTLEAASGVYPARTVGSGFVIGLPATFSGEPYSLTAQVMGTGRLDFIPRRKLLKLLQRSPKVGMQILKMLGEEIFLMRKVAKRTLGTEPALQLH
jgi:CRP-like cAMP-binding protein